VNANEKQFIKMQGRNLSTSTCVWQMNYYGQIILKGDKSSKIRGHYQTNPLKRHLFCENLERTDLLENVNA
jgi:hypothetical protein